MPYEVEDRDSGEVLSTHRTRQGAIDAWREKHTLLTVRIFRRPAEGDRTLIVEGTWHEAKRQRDAHESDVVGSEALDLPVNVAEQVANAIPWREAFPEPEGDE